MALCGIRPPTRLIDSQPFLTPSIPFMASMNLFNLTKLTNGPIHDKPTWPAWLDKLPLDVLKFEGKVGKDPCNHVLSFDLWYSFNNIVGVIAKWYIEKYTYIHTTFVSLDFLFLNFFQLFVPCDEGLKILLSCRQKTTTHIINHVHEKHHRRSLCRITLDDYFFLD